MAGGTRFRRWIQAASLGRDEGKRKSPSRNNKNELLAARTLYVSLDRADNVIEGAASFLRFVQKRCGF
jgi:hypothetical protein